MHLPAHQPGRVAILLPLVCSNFMLEMLRQRLHVLQQIEVSLLPPTPSSESYSSTEAGCVVLPLTQLALLMAVSRNRHCGRHAACRAADSLLSCRQICCASASSFPKQASHQHSWVTLRHRSSADTIHLVACSKTEIERVLRRLIILKVLTEDTRRQDNQYGNVVSQLRVNEVLAGDIERGQMKVTLPFLAAAPAAGGEKAAKKAGKSCQCVLACSSSMLLCPPETRLQTDQASLYSASLR